MNLDIAYLAQGKLYLKQKQAAVMQFDSPFGQWIQQRRLQIQRKNAWKDQGLRSMLMPQPMSASEDQPAEATIPICVTSLCRGLPGEMLYTLETTDMGGLFRFSLSQQREERVFHNTEFRIGHLDYSSEHQLLACSKTYDIGIANLATLPLESVRPTDITAGDSVDIAPRWIPGEKKALVYQSAGVRRNSQGFVVGRSPFTIEQLDFDQETVTTLAEDPNFDLLGPRLTAAGWLYYIRRPYHSYGFWPSVGQFLKDVLLMPLRLIYGIFQFFNAFTNMFTGKPLVTANTQQRVDPPRLRTLGGWLTVQDLNRKHAGDPESPALVPESWELVRQGAQGVPEVVAKSVLSFDIGRDGTVVYTNGSGIYGLGPEGQSERILVGRFVEQVLLIDPESIPCG